MTIQFCDHEYLSYRVLNGVCLIIKGTDVMSISWENKPLSLFCHLDIASTERLKKSSFFCIFDQPN